MTAGRIERVSLAASLAAHLALAGVLAAFAAGGSYSYSGSDVINVSLVGKRQDNIVREAGAAEKKTSSAPTSPPQKAQKVQEPQKPVPESAPEPAPAPEGIALQQDTDFVADADKNVDAGQSTQSTQSTQAAQAASDEAAYLIARDKVRTMIQQRVGYPALARKRGVEGTAVAAFSINVQGRPDGLRLIRSSGHPILDREVLRAIKRASPYPVLFKNRGRMIEVPVTFRIETER
jgi:protein TonB